MPRSLVSHFAAAACGIAAFALFAAAPAPSAAQPDPDPAKIAEGMKKWLDTIKPGEHHEFFKQFVGEWTTSTKLNMGPGAPEMPATEGTASISLIHGGRFLKQETRGSMPMPGPDMQIKPVEFTGLGLTGFDNNRRLYTMAWSDSMSTGLITGTGGLSQDGKTLTMFGQMDEPMTGEMGKTVRFVTRSTGPDSFVFEIAEVIYGDPFTVVEITYTRKK